MQIQYHGHSCVQVSEKDHSIIIDPYITGNPFAVTNLSDIRVQHVLLTHGHFDHITDAASVAKQNNASIIAAEELALIFEKQGLQTEVMHVGGQWDFGFGRVHLTQASHASSFKTEDGESLYAGEPVGLVVEMGGVTLYHAGDTGLFGDMKWLGERFDIDIAFLPIGGRFTMGPDDAAVAAEWIRARCVIPIHYDTFPPIRQDGHAFLQSLAGNGIPGRILAPGETIQIDRRG